MVIAMSNGVNDGLTHSIRWKFISHQSTRAVRRR